MFTSATTTGPNPMPSYTPATRPPAPPPKTSGPEPWDYDAALRAMVTAHEAVAKKRLDPYSAAVRPDAAAVVDAHERRDLTGVRSGCERLIETVATLDSGSYVWQIERTEPDPNAADA